MHYVLEALQGYVDSNMEGDKDSMRSTTRYFFTVVGTTISWISKMQKVVALSTTKAEYVVVSEASKEMIWLQRFIEELGKKQENSRLYYDIESSIILQRTHPSIRRLSIYSSGTISYDLSWKMDI
jgi:hypothetical protein